MNKGLEALRNFQYDYTMDGSINFEYLDTIENELKRLEELESRIEELEETNHCMFIREHRLTEEKGKQDEILRIIKEKSVDVCYFMNCKTLKEYNDDILASYAYDKVDTEQRALTQEEYDLLKQVLQ